MKQYLAAIAVASFLAAGAAHAQNVGPLQITALRSPAVGVPCAKFQLKDGVAGTWYSIGSKLADFASVMSVATAAALSGQPVTLETLGGGTGGCAGTTMVSFIEIGIEH